jgi:DNA-binding SARP family transcriptional activator
VLLLHRGELLATERLIDALWNDAAPPTAGKALSVYVAHLRRALGSEAVQTRRGGYALALNGLVIDTERFEQLGAEGRRLLNQGDAGEAALRLRAALALWRGAPLGDFAYAEFAQEAIARLEESRLTTLEARIDADLALERHADVVAELQGLARAHPLRERVHAQLMLALSRSGRQAEALALFSDLRRRMVDELGLEPGPELQDVQRAVLAQEPMAVQRGWVAGRSARRSRAAVIAGMLVAAVAVAAGAVALLGHDGGNGSVPVRSDSVAVIDADSGRVVGDVPVGRSPATIAAGQGAVWTLNADDRTISRIDPATRTQRTFGIGAPPTDLAAGEGALWVGNGGRVTGAQFAGSAATSLARLDPRTAALRSSTLLPRAGPVVSNAALQHIAFTSGTVWAVGPDTPWCASRRRATASLPPSAA